MTVQQIINLVIFSGTLPLTIGLVYVICQIVLQKKGLKYRVYFLEKFSRMAAGKVKYGHKDSIQQQELAIEYTQGLFRDNGIDEPPLTSIIVAVDAALFEASKPVTTTAKKAEKTPEKPPEKPKED